MKKKIFIILMLIIILLSISGRKKNMTPKEECEELMSNLIPFAEEMLQKYSEFFPYGSVMNNDGSIKNINYYDGNEKPLSKQVIENLIKVYHELAIKKEIKASGIVWDGKVSSPKDNTKTDAVLISLEHKDNYSVIVVFPYKIKNGNIIWDDIFAMKGENNIFK